MRGASSPSSPILPHARLIWAFILCLQAGCYTGESVRRSTAAFPPGTGFLTKTVQVDGTPRKYAVFIPRNYTPQAKYPAILFLHGLFEAGSDGIACLGAGLGPIIAENPDTWPFISIFPHSTGNWKGAGKHQLAMACLDEVQSQYSVDPDRVILAGMSLGGRGVWSIGAKHRDRFAALVPVAADTSYDDCVRLANIPIWCFHSNADPVIAAEGSEDMCNRIAKAGGMVRFTRFRGFSHDCWRQAILESDLLKWMLTQRREDAQAAVFIEP